MLRGMTTISFVGAGSAEFTRQLLRDLLGPTTTSARSRWSCTTSTNAGSGWPSDVARLDRRPPRARGGGARRAPTAAAALAGADFVVNTVNVGGHAATLTDFEVPGPVRRAPDHRRHARRRRRLPRRCARSRCSTRWPSDMPEVCPDAWLLNYTNPMAMNLQYLGDRHPRRQGPGAVPLGVLDGARPLRAGRRPARGGDVPQRRGQPPGLGAALGARRREPLPAARRSASPPTPSCAAGCASTCTGGSATTRPRPASTPASTSRGTSTTRPRSRACGSPSTTTSASAPTNVAEIETLETARRGRVATSSPRRRRPSTRPRSCTAWSPGRRARSR